MEDAPPGQSPTPGQETDASTPGTGGGTVRLIQRLPPFCIGPGGYEDQTQGESRSKRTKEAQAVDVDKVRTAVYKSKTRTKTHGVRKHTQTEGDATQSKDVSVEVPHTARTVSRDKNTSELEFHKSFF